MKLSCPALLLAIWWFDVTMLSAQDFTLESPERSAVISLASHPDGRLLAYGCRNGIVVVWDLEANVEKARLTLQGDIRALAFSMRGDLLHISSENGRLVAWQHGANRITRDSKLGFGITGLGMSGDGSLLAIVGHAGDIRLINVEDNASVLKHTSEDAFLHGVAYDPKGKSLIVGNRSNLEVLNIAAGKAQVVTGHKDDILCVAYSPDGKLAASGSVDSFVRLWNSQTWKEQEPPLRHPFGIAGVAFSPKGDMLASVGAGGILRLWDVSKHALMQEHKFADKRLIWRVQFSRNGRFLAASTDDGNVLVWEMGKSVRKK